MTDDESKVSRSKTNGQTCINGSIRGYTSEVRRQRERRVYGGEDFYFSLSHSIIRTLFDETQVQRGEDKVRDGKEGMITRSTCWPWCRC